MSHIDYLRAKLMAGAKPFEFKLYLDPDSRAAVDDAVAALVRAHEELSASESLTDEERPKRKIGDPQHRTVLERAVKEAEQAVEDAEAAAAGEVVVLSFRVLDPDEYNELAAKHYNVSTGHYDAVAINRAATEAGFVGAFSLDGEPLGVAWSEVRLMLNNADYDMVLVGVMRLNRAPSLVPFSRASSGQPATS